jgi:hypothetical protein
MSAITQCPLDHAVISVRDRMDEAATLFRRMGFALTDRGHHSTGSCNHLMVFERDYLELIGFPPAGQTIRPDLLQAPIGLDGLVLKATDPHAIHRALVTCGFPAAEPQALARKITLPGSTVEQEARFNTVRRDAGARLASIVPVPRQQCHWNFLVHDCRPRSRERDHSIRKNPRYRRQNRG